MQASEIEAMAQQLKAVSEETHKVEKLAVQFDTVSKTEGKRLEALSNSANDVKQALRNKGLTAELEQLEMVLHAAESGVNKDELAKMMHASQEMAAQLRASGDH